MPECLHYGTQKWPPHTQNSYYQNSMTVHWAYHIANSFYFSCNEQVFEILNLYHPVKESFRNPQLVTPCRRKAVPFQILDNVITHTCFPSMHSLINLASSYSHQFSQLQFVNRPLIRASFTSITWNSLALFLYAAECISSQFGGRVFTMRVKKRICDLRVLPDQIWLKCSR